MSAFPGRLQHHVPAWVPDGATFHLRLRIDPTRQKTSLATETVAPAIIHSVEDYERRGLWFAPLLVIMPDHLHLLVGFARDRAMAATVRQWKRFLSRSVGIRWQTNFFDHCIRDAREWELKADYIRQNPVRAGLVDVASDWPWKRDLATGVDRNRGSGAPPLRSTDGP